MKKKNRKYVDFNPRMVEMMDEIAEATGQTMTSAIIRQAIIEMHRKHTMYKAGGTKMTAEGAAQRKEDLKKAREGILLKGKENICTELGGSVSMTEAGNKVCNYYTYSYGQRFAQALSLTLLTTDMLKTQYDPSKEKILQLQKEGKVDYK